MDNNHDDFPFPFELNFAAPGCSGIDKPSVARV